MQNKTVSRITLTSSEIKGGFEGYFYWRKVKSFQKDGDTADVLVLMFWLCARQFKIPINFLFSCCLYIFLGNFPQFSVHKSLKILEKYIANFLYELSQNKATSSQVHLI